MTQEQLDYMQDYHELPSGWEWVRLGSICDAINGRAFKSTEWRDEGLPIIRIQNLKDPEAPFNYFQGDLKEQHRVTSGELLFAWSGTPGTSFGAHIWPGPDAALNQHIFNIRFDRDAIDPKYFLYALNQNVTRYVEQAQGGVGLAHITKSKFLASTIPLAPVAQQKRIVAEIEKQFSRLDEAVANLRRVKTNLKRYKAAVLKAAVEGKLTEEWRKTHPDIEPASRLLERILAERRAKWEEAELAKMHARGKVPKNNSWREKYREPCTPDIDEKNTLPMKWSWATVEQINLGSRPCAYGVLQPGQDLSDGVPFVRVGDIHDGSIHTDGLKRISPQVAIRYPRTRLLGGELLITLVGAIGRTALVPQELKGANVARAVGVVPLSEKVDRRWVEIWFRNPAKVADMTSKSHEVARKTLNLEDVRSAWVAIPPIAEQDRIVTEVDRHLSLIRETEAQVDTNLQRAERLRQSLLARAFSGGLVGSGKQASSRQSKLPADAGSGGAR